MITEWWIISCALVVLTSTLHLPDYIRPCKRNDPNLNDCAKHSAIAALSSIIAGDKKYKNSPLSPYKVSLIDIDGGPNLKIQFSDLVVIGFKTLKISDLTIDLKNNKAYIQLAGPMNFQGVYDIKGQILVLPINGHGGANITFVDGAYDVDVSWSIVDKNNVEYVKVDTIKVKLNLKKVLIHLDKLFNGDKNLGDSMNQLLNENWQDVMKEISPGAGKAIAEVLGSVFKNYVEYVPLNEIFV
ncbi:protein takeout [Aethina tumida]|uniref:protein takeout n=1 Tax=Aethina tumida TaxID=116153 RepID=UPI00096B03E3|nr:protein takeout [Aethina tumida]